jgi:DNA primase
VDGRAKLVELARPLIRRIPSDVYRELLVSQLAEAVRMPPARLAELLQAGETAGPTYGEPANTGRRPARPVSAAGAGRGNLVRQAISLLVHFPAAAAQVGETEALQLIDRPGVPLLTELLAQMKEDPPASMAALLERWRGRPEHGPLSKLAAAECLVADVDAAAAEIRSAIDRLVAEECVARLETLQQKASEATLSAEEKHEIQLLIRAKAQIARPKQPI